MSNSESTSESMGKMEKISPEKLQALFAQMSKMLEGTGMKVPPPIFTHMKGEFINIDFEENSMLLSFPIMEEFENPMGYMQGGMIAAAIDNALGPLSFMLAPPSVTKTMTVEYKRPIQKTLDSILVHAQLDSRTEKELYLSATVSSEVQIEAGLEKTVHATATAVQVILRKQS